MRKKDYELIAGSLKLTKEWGKDFRVYRNGAWVANSSFTILCENLANTFNRDNPKFDRQKFLTACGIEQPKIESKDKNIQHLNKFFGL